jgi:ATP-binding cassette subfamily B protein
MPAGKLDMRVVFALGKRYFAPRKLLVAIYILFYLLCQPVIPVAISLYSADLTNYFSATARGEAARSSPDQKNTPQAAQVSGLAKEQLLPFYIYWAILTLSLLGAGFCQKYISSLLATRVANDIRRDLFARLLQRSSQFFHENPAEQLTIIVNQFCVQVQMGLQSLMVDPVLNLIGMVTVGWTLYHQLVAGAGRLGSQVWVFFWLIIAVALISPWIVGRMGRRLQRSTRELQQQMLLIQSLVGGALKAPEEIQAMRAEPAFNTKHRAALDYSLKAKMRQTATMEMLNVTNHMPGDIVLISLLGLAVYVALAGVTGISSGVVILLFTLTPQLMNSIQGLSQFPIVASINWPAIEAVNRLLSFSEARERQAAAGEVPPLEPTIEARDLSFWYPGAESHRVLDSVSFTIPPRKITGFVAKAGQGKTTFFRLALRFYEPVSGEIFVGGERHDSLPLNVLRRQLVLMHQTPAFFYDTVRENFLIAKPEATDEEIEQICRKTPLWEILENSYGKDPLDKQFAGGNFLSGGQKKLFALTRCLLRDPSILLLDEPTTGIDPDEKFELLAMMREACKGRTVLVVDHDIVGWQVLFCDYFFVLDKGRIMQRGTAGELLHQPGLFRQLFDKQAEGCHKMFELLKKAGTPAT